MQSSKNIRVFNGIRPALGQGVFVDPTAVIIGDVVIGADCSVWPGAVVRGDVTYIRVGNRTNIQDNAVLHNTHASDWSDEHPLVIGNDVTIGHHACLHGCTVGDRVLVGIHATVLDGVHVPDDVMIAAGALLPPGKRLESGHLYMGAPAVKARTLTDEERRFLGHSAVGYVALKNTYLSAGVWGSLPV